MMDSIDGKVRLTSLAHGGGCGCKLAPAVLQDLLSGMPKAGPYEKLLVGTETGDDAAVWNLDGQTAIIATTDFFMPMVDDPRDFGRIAATNALSDIYAMGGRPIMALAIVGMPVNKLDAGSIRAILAGGAEVCGGAGIPVAGGHSIDCPEPVYGLAVIGTARVDRIRRNATAQPGDRLILTKALGVGVYSAAFKKDALSPDAYGELILSTTRLNSVGADLSEEPAVHAMTDVTGFGILGHGLEMARGSSATVAIEAGALPFLSQAGELARQGFVTGASHRNWQSYGADVALPDGLPDWKRHLLTDPQTSGGLLLAVDPAEAGRILLSIREAGYPAAADIGSIRRGEACLVVEDA